MSERPNKSRRFTGFLLILLIVIGSIFWAYNYRRGNLLNSALFEAVREFNPDEVDRTLSLGADANSRDVKLALPQNRSPLESLGELFHPRSPDQLGPTPLMELVYRVDLKYKDSTVVSLWEVPQPRIVHSLISHGADVNVTYPEDMQWANKTTSPRIPLLSIAIERADYATVAELVAHGAKTNSPGLSSRDYEYAPLVEAITHDRYQTVKLLLGLGVDVNERMPTGETTLGLATKLSNAAPGLRRMKSVVSEIKQAGGRF